MPVRRKLYVYIDESGQDTGGIMFVVSVLVLQEERGRILEILEAIEERSKKGNVKWRKARRVHRQSYITEIARCVDLHSKIFFEVFSDSKKYIELTSYAAAKAILKNTKGDYRVTVFVDGFKRREIEVFTKGLRDLRIKTRKVRGIKREENNAFIRLVDAICGLVRDAYEDNKGAKTALDELKNKRIITEL